MAQKVWNADAFHLIAECKGVAKERSGSGLFDNGETECAICGLSPYPVGRSTKKMFGSGFSDWDRITDAPDVCTACEAVFGGKPSKTDPPIRMKQVIAIQGEPIRYIKRAEFEDVLRNPPSVPFVLVWNDSMKKHGAFSAGISSAEEMIIGGDAGTVFFRPVDHMGLLDACKELRGTFNRSHILTGSYPPKRAVPFGLRRLERLEAIVAKRRPSYLLDFIIGTISAPEPEEDQNQEEEEMAFSETDRKAAHIVRELCRNAQIDVQWGVFHSGFAKKRVIAAKSVKTLHEFVEKLGGYMNTKNAGMKAVVQFIDPLSEIEEDEILQAIKKRPGLIVGLASIKPEELDNE